MPDKEKVKEVQTLVDKLDTLPETAKQRILGIAAKLRHGKDLHRNGIEYPRKETAMRAKEKQRRCVAKR